MVKVDRLTWPSPKRSGSAGQLESVGSHHASSAYEAVPGTSRPTPINPVSASGGEVRPRKNASNGPNEAGNLWPTRQRAGVLT